MCSLFAGEFKPSERHCKLLEEEKQVAQKSNRNLQYKGDLEGKQYGPLCSHVAGKVFILDSRL